MLTQHAHDMVGIADWKLLAQGKESSMSFAPDFTLSGESSPRWRWHPP